MPRGNAAVHDHEIIDGVGPRLRTLRQSSGWSLGRLAELSGITVSTLSRLERGLVRASLEQLLPLARVYGMPLDELVAAPRLGDPRVHLRPVRRDGLTYVPLGIHAGGLQAFKVIYPPLSNAAAPSHHTHPGRQWLYVLSGAITIALGERRTIVEVGEVAEFDTMTPHWVLNDRQDRPAEIIAIYGLQGERVHRA